MDRIPHKVVARVLIALVLIALSMSLLPRNVALSQVSGNNGNEVASLDDVLPTAVKESIVAIKGGNEEDVIELFDVKTEGDWAAGMAMIYPVGDHVGPYLFLFVAHRQDQNSAWQVAVEYAPDYATWLQAAPTSVLSAAHLAGRVLPGYAPSSADQIEQIEQQDPLRIGLPWALGETQYLTSGPHPDSPKTGAHPWSALDFSGGSLWVRAPADGIVYRKPNCPYVQINMGNGWQTGFYHLSNIAVGNGQQIMRGTILGKQSTATDCGGVATGPHVHMTLRLNGQHQNWDGQAIGGWRVQEGRVSYEGCFLRSGAQRCAVSAIYNDGVIGEDSAPTPMPTATAIPTRTPNPTQLPTVRPTKTATKTPTRTPSPMATATGVVVVSPVATATSQGPDPSIRPTVVPTLVPMCGWTTVVPNVANARLADNRSALTCYTLPVAARGVISDLAVSLAMTHTWISDLRMQLRSPDGKMLTLMNRPGWPTNAYGFGANLSAVWPITFATMSTNDAELMGGLDTRRTICRDDGRCDFQANGDHDATGNVENLAGFIGSNSEGDWQICLSDNAKGDVGTIASLGLKLDCALDSDEPVQADDVCEPVEALPNKVIPDNNASGLCVDFPISTTATVNDVALQLGLTHPFLGDLRVQLIGPNSTALTVLNRAGLPATRFGDTSNLLADYTLIFADDAPNDAEQMGQTVGGNGVACKDDLRCRYRPNADGDAASTFAHLSDFAGQPSVGVWRVCVSDLSAVDTGMLKSAKLDLTCSAGAPEATPTPQGPTATPMPTLTPTAPSSGPDTRKMEENDDSGNAAIDMIWLPMLLR